MKAIPLLDTAAPADAWHAVRAPGGYEEWRFDADDPATDTQLFARLVVGDPFDGNYVRAVERYRRNPTSTPPPVAANYPVVEFVLIQNGHVRQQVRQRLQPGVFGASSATLDVAIGSSRAMRDEDALRLLVEVPTSLGAKESLFVDLTFTPHASHPPQTFVPFSRAITGGDHHSAIPHGACHVRGVIPLPTQNGMPPVSVDFTGRGVHTHSFGTSTLASVDQVLRGRVLLADRAIVFSGARARDHSLPDELHFLEAREGGTEEVPGLECVDSAVAGFPSAIKCGDSLSLSSPKVIQTTKSRTIVRYDAVARGESAIAICELSRPARGRNWLGWSNP